MILEYLGWQEAADLIVIRPKGVIRKKRIPYDAEWLVEGMKLFN